MKKFWGVVLVSVVCLAMTSPVWSQSQITAGTIQGDVTDEKGGLVPDATVEIRNLDTNFTKTQTTDSDGRFRFLLLPSGRYAVTISKPGFATIVLENVSLTVGQTISLPMSMKVSAVQERIVVTATPTVEVTKTGSSTTLNQLTVSETPILGRKFEDLLTLTPGVSIVQAPDGDEINFNGQRGIFNNISLDGGDYNNGFFGEQYGGQRAAIDITLEAVKEFQVVASGASAEFGRTAGGVVNVITKSGTNDVHGSAFGFFRTERLSSNTSDGKPLKDFSRQQFGGSLGGPIVKNKMFFFGAAEGIRQNLTRDNLSAQVGSTACPVQAPTILANETLINTNPDCQRLALLTYYKNTLGQQEGNPIDRPVRNAAVLGRWDWQITPANQLSTSYNFDYSKNTNETFDVPTYGNSANGIEGPSKIQAVNANFNSTVSATKLNEAHFTYARENRPRNAVTSKVPPDTGIGTPTPARPTDPSFRFGQPFFLQPSVDELLWRSQVRDSFSIVSGKHTWKFGGEWLHSVNTQVFRGFFTARYLFDSVDGFLRYVSNPALGPGFGPTVAQCADGTFGDIRMPSSCPGGFAPGNIFSFGPGPLIGYIQHAGRTGPATDASGASSISNQNYALFIQDKWQIWPNFTFNYGLRWEAQVFPDPTVPPAQTAYGFALSNPKFPSNGTIPNQKKMFQPRVGFAWDIANNHKSVLRASWGIYNANQNMLTQVGAITTNGVQQQSIFVNTAIIGFGATPPPYPGVLPPAPAGSCPNPPGPPNPFPCLTGVQLFSRDYANPRIYATNVAFEQEIYPNWAVYVDFAMNKAVHLTRFIDPNIGPTFTIPTTGDRATYAGTPAFPPLGNITDTASSAKSLYRGVTFGVRKRFNQHFQMEANYTYSKDLDDDSNERDPFSIPPGRYFNFYDLSKDYSSSDRDNRHRFNFYTYAELPWGFQADVRMQAHSAQPITASPRVLNGVDRGRNSLRKDTQFFAFNWRLQRPFKFGERFALIPIVEMFNTFNNKNNVNPLSTPSLTNFDGFLRQGVGDPRQAQFAVRLTF